MTRAKAYEHLFVRSFPDRLDDGVLYVSVGFANTAHRCMCGCGQEVYAQLSPRDWSMTFDGEAVSLHPSIGNWSFPCQSHYWLRRGSVSWADQWSKEQIERGRTADRMSKSGQSDSLVTGTTMEERPSLGFVTRLMQWFKRL